VWPCRPTFSHMLQFRHSGKPFIRSRDIPEAENLVNACRHKNTGDLPDTRPCGGHDEGAMLATRLIFRSFIAR
jgi:hypothetical protein